MKSLAFLFIRGYQILISPAVHALFGSGFGCRYSPTCSEYCRVCFERFHFYRAFYLSVSRVLSCQPWSKRRVVDPVPE